jgi:hypothetical protein
MGRTLEGGDLSPVHQEPDEEYRSVKRWDGKIQLRSENVMKR